MESRSDKIILFPRLKKTLEEESLRALQEKRYDEALEKLDELLSYHVDNHEILIGKLICLMELGRYQEAQDLCEELLQHKNEDYYQYVHIYLTILFQTNQYDLLMEQVEEELENDRLPDMLHEQFRQLYDMSKKMKLDMTVDRSSLMTEDLLQAVNEDNHSLQWQIINQLRNMKTAPDKKVESLLASEVVHPVIKTALLLWMKDAGMSEEVEIHKFSSAMEIVPAEVPDIRRNDMYQKTLFVIQELEEKNPSLYDMLEKLLYRYIYVVYPFLPESEDVLDIADAIRDIGVNYLHIHTSRKEISEKAKHFIREIRMCDSLYLSIIEE